MPSPVCPPIACALFIGCLELAASIMMCMLHDDDLEQYIQHENFQVLDPDNIFFSKLHKLFSKYMTNSKKISCIISNSSFPNV